MEPNQTLERTTARAPRRALCMGALQPVLRMVECELGEKLHVLDMAGVLGLSQFHFCREFRRVMGVSPYAYVTRRRIARAALLLAGSGLSIAEIGKSVGFKSHAHFTHAFVQSEKKTPREYRSIHAAGRETPGRSTSRARFQPGAAA